MLNAVSSVAYGQNAYLSVYAANRAAQRTLAVPAASPGAPVQAVDPVRPVPESEPVTARPELLSRWDNDPVSMAVQSRIEYLDDAALERLRGETKNTFADSAPARAYAASAAALPHRDAVPRTSVLEQAENALGIPGAKSPREVMEEGECQTCKERKYQDGSDDPGVSFKTAQHIAPELAAAEVRGHEMEHVVREQASAQRQDRRVVSQSVTYHTAICPECGKAYVSGGTTRTTTAANRDPFAVGRGQGKESGGFSALI